MVTLDQSAFNVVSVASIADFSKRKIYVFALSSVSTIINNNKKCPKIFLGDKLVFFYEYVS